MVRAWLTNVLSVASFRLLEIRTLGAVPAKVVQRRIHFDFRGRRGNQACATSSSSKNTICELRHPFESKGRFDRLRPLETGVRDLLTNSELAKFGQFQVRSDPTWTH